MVEEVVTGSSLKDSRSRSVAVAFLSAAGASPNLKLSHDEKDLADYLTPFAAGVIKAEGEKYRDAMNTLLTASGASEKVS